MEVDQEYTITDQSTAAAVSEYLHRFVARAGVSVQLSARVSKYDGVELLSFSRDRLHIVFNGPGDDPHVQAITQSLYGALHPAATSADDDDHLVITGQSTADAVELLSFSRDRLHSYKPEPNKPNQQTVVHMNHDSVWRKGP
ncbi:Uncharacterized protein PBTT_03082 [Plasmodiophora brassicae]